MSADGSAFEVHAGAPFNQVEIDETKWQVWIQGETKCGLKFQARQLIGENIHAGRDHLGAIVGSVEGHARELVRKHNEGLKDAK